MFGAIAEESLFGRMGMKIEVELECRAMGSFELHGQIMEGGYLWKDVFVEFVELSIQVLSAEAGPEIASNHSIRIEHGYNMENEVISKYLAQWIIRNQKLDKSLEYE